MLAAPAVAKFSGKSSIRLLTISVMGIPTAILIWAMKHYLLNQLDPQIYNPVNLYAAFILPIFVSGLMFSYIFLPGRENRIKYYVITALFFVAVFYPLDGVVADIKTQAIQDRVTNRFKNIRQWNPDLIDRGVQLTRSFRALKLWLTFQVFGLDAIEAAITRGFELAEYTERSLRAMPGWEIETSAQMGIVTFRCAKLSNEEHYQIDHHLACRRQMADVALHVHLALFALGGRR